jgi:hypothetical protein
MSTIHSLAGEAYDCFERRERDNGDSFVSLKDNAPEWLSDLVRDAHGDFLPDDWRYASIRSALGAIHDAGEDADVDDLSFEFADSNVDTHNAARCEWLASHLARGFYCDDAVNEGLVADDSGIFTRIGIGQYIESREVFESVRRSLSDRLDEMIDEDEDDA